MKLFARNARPTRIMHRWARAVWLVAILLFLCFVCLFGAACEDIPDGPAVDGTRFASVTEDFRTEYYVGEAFEAVGELKIYFDVDYFDVVPITADMVSGFDSTAAGDIILTITYQDFVATVPIQVRALSAVSITLYNVPDVIYKGEAFPSDMTLSAQMADGTSRKDVPVTESMLSRFDSSVIGGQNVQVTYCGATETFYVEIEEDRRVEISLIGAKEEYAVNEALSVAGAQLYVTYKSGKVQPTALTANLVSGFTTATGGWHIAKIKYTRSDGELECDYRYFVKKLPQKFSLTKSSLPAVFEPEASLPTGGAGVLEYDDGSMEQISDLTMENIPDFDTSAAVKDKKIDVVVKGVKDTYTYTVLPRIVEATPYGYTSAVGEGEDFDGHGVLVVIYEDTAGVFPASETISFIDTSEGVQLKKETAASGAVVQTSVYGGVRVEYCTSACGDVAQKVYFRTVMREFLVHVYSEEEGATAVDSIMLITPFPSIRLGDPINVSGVKIAIVYKYLDNGNEPVDCLASWVSATMPQSIEGDSVEVAVTVSAFDVTTTGTLTVLSPAFADKVTSISVSGIPDLYSVDDDLALDKARLYVVQGNGYASKTIEVDPAFVFGFDTAAASAEPKKMTIKYEECEDYVEYRVLGEEDKTRVTDLSVANFSPRLFVGDSVNDINRADYTVTLTLGYGYGSGEISLADDTVTLTGGPFAASGWQEVTLTYAGVEKELYVMVHDASEKDVVTSIAIVPDSMTSDIGVQPDLSQVVMTVTYGYGYRTEYIFVGSEGVSVDYSAVDCTKEGNARAVVTYAGVSCGLFINFVSDDSGNILRSLSVEDGSKTEFRQGDAFGGVNLLLYYKDRTERLPATEKMVPKFSTDTPGEHSVTISYGGKGVLYAYIVLPSADTNEG